MKKSILIAGLSLVILSARAQNGLENIIVEKYYVSDANDTSVNADGGILPVGSVTYRIYVDMLPGYKFQAAFGIPGHELRLQTTTLFFNNEDRGASTPTYTKTQAANNTVMLDSWLSVGAACTGQFGVLKSDDDGAATVINSDAVLQNSDTAAGIPLTVQDGMIPGNPEPVTAVGISTEMAMFDNQNDGTNGPLFSTFNGSWASLNGSTGPDSTTNKVLIAQMTTDGVFSFELNIQIGTPSGGVEQYVAVNAQGNEILFPGCTYSSITTNINAVVPQPGSFTIYPNPAADEKICLEVNGALNNSKGRYTIFDNTGKVVLRKNIGNISGNYFESIDLSGLPSGNYVIEMFIDDKKSSGIIIKN